MFHGFVRTLVKLAVASLVVGAIMNHFGVTAEHLLAQIGLTPERAIELTHQAMNWALPNLMLGALVIVPAWFVLFLFRPPRPRDRLN
jgi:Family of unknown function (DUF6460)